MVDFIKQEVDMLTSVLEELIHKAMEELIQVTVVVNLNTNNPLVATATA